MLKPVRDETPDAAQPLRRRRRLAAVAMFPTMLTMGNLIFGFAAIYDCGLALSNVKPSQNRVFFERAPSFLSVAVWMVVFAMICDALDGRIARLTKRASKFGEQLDSLADVVSFGVAPALMMATLMHREIAPLWYASSGFGRFGQLVLFVGLIYACCAALRLARFNVETSIDESAHRGFKGCPSPGAAGGVVSTILLYDHLDQSGDWPNAAAVLIRALPFMTLAIALLMVSRVPYTHAVSSFLRRRPLWHVVLVLLILPFLYVYSELTLFVAAWAFVLSGPARLLYRRIRPIPEQAPAAGFPVAPAEEPRPKSSMES